MKRPGFALLLLATTMPAFSAVALPAGLSEAMRPPADEEPAFVLNAKGVQVYTCKEKGPYQYGWTFVAPEAALSDNGKPAGRHFAGPTWESSDGSSVKGAVKQKQDGGAGNVPWLMLSATPSGQGRFAGVTTVLRVATQGGAEPAGGCDEYGVNTEARIPYTADYYFFKKR
ncbi:MAG TPA: DUF3455 domain-containing protein [Usitatibacter sp.]|nr:DUF3455 domain-containing protein [Usitatibacter sp.]